MPDVLERAARLDDRGQRRDAGVVLEDLGRGGGAALHAVDDDHVGAALGGQLHVVERRASRRS